MVAGLKFLSKKSFNPKNAGNQKTVWERQQERAEGDKKARERERQLQRERDDEELQRARGDTPRVAFLYSVPPGLEGAADGKSSRVDEEGAASRSATGSTSGHRTADAGVSLHRQPGDDEAAAAFRALLASSSRGWGETQEVEEEDRGFDQAATKPALAASFGTTVLQGTSHDPVQAALEKSSSGGGAAAQQSEGGYSSLSALEKAVGRKPQHAAASASLTLEEQIQRFPALAHAPRERGISASHVGVSFRPLGTQIRNVRCLACGVWGHSRGERECRVSGWNPFDASATSAAAAADPSSTEASRGGERAVNDVRADTKPRDSEETAAARSSTSRRGGDDDRKRRRQGRRKRPRSDDAAASSGAKEESDDDDRSSSDGSRDHRARREAKRKERKKSGRKHRRRSRKRSRRDDVDGEGEGSDGSESSSSSSDRRRRRKKDRKRREKRERRRRADGEDGDGR
jgi:hypothetical protein